MYKNHIQLLPLILSYKELSYRRETARQLCMSLSI